jgi:hypothetical protein
VQSETVATTRGRFTPALAWVVVNFVLPASWRAVARAMGCASTNRPGVLPWRAFTLPRPAGAGAVAPACRPSPAAGPRHGLPVSVSAAARSFHPRSRPHTAGSSARRVWDSVWRHSRRWSQHARQSLSCWWRSVGGSVAKLPLGGKI